MEAASTALVEKPVVKVALKSSSVRQQNKKKTPRLKTNNLRRCSHCEYKSNKTGNFKQHMIRHEMNFPYKCPLCSFSARSETKLSIHLKLHHKEGDKKLEALSNLNKPEEWYETPSGKRQRYQFCSDCDYKTTSKYNFILHTKNKHPSSATYDEDAKELIKRRSQKRTLRRCAHCQFTSYCSNHFQNHMEHHVKKFTHQCHRCNYSATVYRALSRHLNQHHSESKVNNTNNDDEIGNIEQETNSSTISSSVNNSEREEYYTSYNGKKRRYMFCGDCDYKTLTWKALGVHVNVMHPSSTTAHPLRPSTRIAGTWMQCAECDFGTCVKRSMRLHMEGHQRKSTHQCRLCSFSGEKYRQLVRHLNRDHSNTRMEPSEVDDDDSGDVPDAEKVESRAKKEKYYFKSNGLRKKFKFCLDCDYESLSWNGMRRHVSLMHPSSTKTFLPAPNNKIGRPKQIHKREEEKKDGKWLYRPNGSRLKYKFCEDCDYKTVYLLYLKNHVKKHHPNSTMKVTSSRKKIIRRCDHCSFKAFTIRDLMKHKRTCYDKKNLNYLCHICSYVTDSLVGFGLHVKNHLQKGNHITADNKHIWVKALGPLENGLKTLFGLRECRVILQDILPYSISERAHSTSSAIATVRPRKSREEIRSIRLRVEAMEKKVRLADEELKQISSKRKDVMEKIQQITTQKGILEKDQVLENELTEKGDQLNNLEDELLILQLEDKNLFEDLGDAEGSYIGATQVLLALQSDLERLESDK